jgi:hypothetical protein
MKIYSFFLDKTKLPFAPPTLKVSINNKNTTITLINEGEVNILKTAGLTDVEFTVRVPQTQYTFADKVQPADIFLSKLENLKNSCKPFQFVVSRLSPANELLFDTNLKVSLESYEINEDAEEGFDLLVDVRLKQFRDFATKTIQIQDDGTATVADTVQRNFRRALEESTAHDETTNSNMTTHKAQILNTRVLVVTSRILKYILLN